MFISAEHRSSNSRNNPLQKEVPELRSEVLNGI